MAKQPSANPKYKLTYFNITGLGEPIRMLFSYGGIEFEDNRIEPENWPALKSNSSAETPMGQVPVLEVDGIEVYQSLAICRYVAKLVGLAGKNDWENLQIDIVVDNFGDLRQKLNSVFFEKDETKKQKMFADLKKDVIPFYLGKMDAIAEENNGYLAVGRLTWADVFVFALSDAVKFKLEYDAFEDYPNLKRVFTNVSSVEPIKAWIKKRPKTRL